MFIKTVFRTFLILTPFALLLALRRPQQWNMFDSSTIILFAYWLFSFYPRKYLYASVTALVLHVAIIFWPLSYLLNSTIASHEGFAWLYMILMVTLFAASLRYSSRSQSGEEELGTRKMALASGFTLENFRSLGKNRIVDTLFLILLALLSFSAGKDRWPSLLHANLQVVLDWVSVAVIVLFAFVVGYYGMGKNSLAIKKILLAFFIAGVFIGIMFLLIFYLNGLLWFQ